MTVALGMMTSSTALRKSSAFTLSRPSNAAEAMATLTAYSSARCPWHTPRTASVTRYFI